jgi:hypothetical protein
MSNFATRAEAGDTSPEMSERSNFARMKKTRTCDPCVSNRRGGAENGPWHSTEAAHIQLILLAFSRRNPKLYE